MTVAASYLKTHMAQIHGICPPQTRGVNKVGGWPTLYMVFFPRVLQEVKCPVPGYPAVNHSTGRLCKHFMYCNLRSKVAVVQEGRNDCPDVTCA